MKLTPRKSKKKYQLDMAFSHNVGGKQKALSRVIAHIRESLDINTIFKITVTEVRQLLNTDRVGVFRFYPDPELEWEGEFIYEDVGAESASILATKMHDHCFVQEFTKLYREGRITAISDIYQDVASDCHVKMLEKFQVRANIAVPLMKCQDLWGLLCIHQCSGPRQWEASEIEFVQLIAEHLGVALQQADYIEQMKLQSAQLAQAKAREKAAEWQKTIARTIEKIRQSLDLENIFRTTTEELRKLLNSDRVAIYRFNPDWSGEFVFEAVTEGWVTLMEEQLQRPELGDNISECKLKDLIEPSTDTYLQDTGGGRFAKGEVYRVCNDIYQAGFSDCYIKVLESYQAKAYVIIAILYKHKIWGLLAVYQNTETRDWQEDEVYLLTQVSSQLGVALQQAELLKHTQHQKEEITKTLKELQATQSQLIQSEKMAGLGQLVAGVAHEINNPISFIYGNIPYVNNYAQDLLKFIRVYQESYPQLTAEFKQQVASLDLDFIADDLPKMLNSMMSGATRIRELVLSLRIFARLDQAEKKPINLHEGIDSTLLILQNRLLQTETNFSDIQVIKEYSNLPNIFCYAAQINQVFLNIINNAIWALEKSMADGKLTDQPKIWIRTKLTGNNSVLICIADNGCGIDEGMESRIFEPFFTTKEPGEGTGLGLSVSYQIIVEKHGGQIKCVSEAGKGCEFLIEIPLKISS
ncbi:GAF domain-containing protein [Anabaena cylindrica FACHB-243]|uniref:histidine kinase n=2 Tax=Anabaena TaxID=1163 RepID=K9ZI43_ANACC|nr:GAF sensor signal transduction histidine kinase [Anabaena cylindrica PCC 7122]MBD2419854.1 GAF domain-containing protein [Anabaena cylindrica FACHB-243]MBY5280980.1 GAF domain-containing protein [Anabaena sp. CCAP 1446/1C]MBY5307369.1 GAF domain-containing protein [Anabaena sp. CCAP 1446/1C]BAY04820.1 GAF sensor signal transduction histidine kinase [Anabaena cylindrica PCC 7122]